MNRNAHALDTITGQSARNQIIDKRLDIVAYPAVFFRQLAQVALEFRREANLARSSTLFSIGIDAIP